MRVQRRSSKFPPTRIAHGGFYNRCRVMETGKALYWAVPCNRCSFVNALALLDFGPKSTAKVPEAVPESFLVWCPICRGEIEQLKSQVVVWLGPQPARRFHTHPAFR